MNDFRDRLKGMRCYLAGPMEFATNNGADWRQRITPFLEELGITVIDPCKTVHKDGMTEPELLEKIKKARAVNDYNELVKVGKPVRALDLRMVDISDFLIVNVDQNIPMCGTWEEIFTANRQKKPILIRWVGGKGSASIWMFGTLPHHYIFNSFDDLQDYIMGINNGDIAADDRWVFIKERGLL